MPSKSYRIKINRGENQFEAEGDKKFVLEMLRKFEKGGSPTSDPSSQEKHKTKLPSSAASSAPAGKKTSVGEFIRQLGFKKHTDIVLAFGYYLEKHSGVASFTAADINACYYEAKLESSNTSQMIIQNIRRTFMMPAKKNQEKGRKAFRLTQSGEEHVEKRPAKAAK